MAYGYETGVLAQGRKAGRSWKVMFALALAAAGGGFAAYGYLVPYQKLLKGLSARNGELQEEKAAVEAAQVSRDKLREELDRRQEEVNAKTMAAEKHKGALGSLTDALKPVVDPLGAQVSSDGAKVKITLTTKSLFEGPFTAAISPDGLAALKVVAGAVGKARPRMLAIRAPLSLAPPPKELQQFHNVGEFSMLRAARVSLALFESGFGSDRLSVVGQAVPPPTGRKPKPGSPPEIVDLLVELD
jgi:hypothetical protein